MLSETWCNDLINITNYNIYRSDKIACSRFPHGGVTIIIHSSIEHTIIKNNNLKLVEGIFIKIQRGLTIGSIYSLPFISQKQFKSEFSNLLSASGPIVIAGDFNAKHQARNNIKNCNKGTILNNKKN